MLREEATSSSAENIILNIYCLDDHLRSIDAWRYLRTKEWFQRKEHWNKWFHNNPWAHIRLDLESGRFIEKENQFSTPDFLYKLCDSDYVYNTFKDDIILQLIVAQKGGTDIDKDKLSRLANLLNIEADFETPQSIRKTAKELHIAYGINATIEIIKKTQSFCENNGKKLLILLSYSESLVARSRIDEPRIDRNLIEFLKKRKIPFVDSLSKHIEEYKLFKISPLQYVKRYYLLDTPIQVGHYNPKGNHFFAFAIKDEVVRMLEPKPLAYRKESETL
jgi:hypothetical protein